MKNEILDSDKPIPSMTTKNSTSMFIVALALLGIGISSCVTYATPVFLNLFPFVECSSFGVQTVGFILGVSCCFTLGFVVTTFIEANKLPIALTQENIDRQSALFYKVLFCLGGLVLLFLFYTGYYSLQLFRGVPIQFSNLPFFCFLGSLAIVVTLYFWKARKIA